MLDPVDLLSESKAQPQLQNNIINFFEGIKHG